jgi:hypothetical protein
VEVSASGIKSPLTSAVKSSSKPLLKSRGLLQLTYANTFSRCSCIRQRIRTKCSLSEQEKSMPKQDRDLRLWRRRRSLSARIAATIVVSCSSHYLVDPVACTPASGLGKGQVEKPGWTGPPAQMAGRRTAAVFGPNWCSEAYLIPKTHFGRVRCSPNLGDVLI